MIARVVAAIAIATTSSAVPIGAPPALHEIAADPSATMCANVVVHTNAAIFVALHDDVAIARVIGLLRTVDFETSTRRRRAAVADAAATSNDLAENVERARTETQRLRAYAEHPAGADRGAELIAFVEPLEAAFEAQRKVADGLASFVGAVQHHDLRESARDIAVGQTDPDDPDLFHTAGRVPNALPTPVAHPGASVTFVARTQASDLETLAAEIRADEARAAVHSEPAVGGC